MRSKRNMTVLDILVNNAAYSASNVPDKMTDGEWSKGVDGVLSSVFRCIRKRLRP